MVSLNGTSTVIKGIRKLIGVINLSSLSYTVIINNLNFPQLIVLDSVGSPIFILNDAVIIKVKFKVSTWMSTNVICSINSKCSVYGELSVVTDDVKLENCEYDAECIS
jgi:hypothetical protein